MIINRKREYQHRHGTMRYGTLEGKNVDRAVASDTRGHR